MSSFEDMQKDYIAKQAAKQNELRRAEARGRVFHQQRAEQIRLDEVERQEKLNRLFKVGKYIAGVLVSRREVPPLEIAAGVWVKKGFIKKTFQMEKGPVVAAGWIIGRGKEVIPAKGDWDSRTNYTSEHTINRGILLNRNGTLGQVTSSEIVLSETVSVPDSGSITWPFKYEEFSPISLHVQYGAHRTPGKTTPEEMLVRFATEKDISLTGL